MEIYETKTKNQLNLYIHPPTHLLIHSPIYPLIHSSTHPSILPPIHPIFHPSIQPPIYPSIQPSTHQSTHQSTHPPINLLSINACITNLMLKNNVTFQVPSLCVNGEAIRIGTESKLLDDNVDNLVIILFIILVNLLVLLNNLLISRILLWSDDPRLIFNK